MMDRFKVSNTIKKVKFLGEELEIKKLTVNQVAKIQAYANELEKNPSDSGNLNMLSLIIKEGVPEFAELDQEVLFEFPMDELSKLSDSILAHSGLGKQQK